MCLGLGRPSAPAFPGRCSFLDDVNCGFLGAGRTFVNADVAADQVLFRVLPEALVRVEQRAGPVVVRPRCSAGPRPRSGCCPPSRRSRRTGRLRESGRQVRVGHLLGQPLVQRLALLFLLVGGAEPGDSQGLLGRGVGGLENGLVNLVVAEGLIQVAGCASSPLPSSPGSYVDSLITVHSSFARPMPVGNDQLGCPELGRRLPDRAAPSAARSANPASSGTRPPPTPGRGPRPRSRPDAVPLRPGPEPPRELDGDRRRPAAPRRPGPGPSNGRRRRRSRWPRTKPDGFPLPVVAQPGADRGGALRR